jgi:AAA15 family ATPase/GTPase
MVLAVMSCQNGCVLIDEIENGLYHTAHKPVWRALIEAAGAFNVQIFATTHSLECVAAAHDAARECLHPDLSTYRLERTDGDIRAVSLPFDSLDTALEQEWEVR